MKDAPYEKLKFYQNICEIRRLVYKVTESFRGDNLRLVSQMRDAARSAKPNIREGYRKDTVGKIGHSIKISAGSLDELEGDIDDCLEDGLISKEKHNQLMNLLRVTNYQIDRYLDALYKLDREGK